MKKTAGIIAFRRNHDSIDLFLVHPGGPFWVAKDVHAWSVPKGEFSEEDALTAAKREFREETGQLIEGEFTALPPQKAQGKTFYLYAVESSAPDPDIVQSNTFELEWPPKSGYMQQFPEVDRAAWVPLEQAPLKLHKNQQFILQQLAWLIR
ncbi:NUDIX domain-containing protein [Proteobacteria bacterium 005FR1]|nr:NUDIX domain-containing protein [Proteobacteria bacterium 005FR1]